MLLHLSGFVLTWCGWSTHPLHNEFECFLIPGDLKQFHEELLIGHKAPPLRIGSHMSLVCLEPAVPQLAHVFNHFVAHGFRVLSSLGSGPLVRGGEGMKKEQPHTQ